jgi:hypothetical protein
MRHENLESNWIMASELADDIFQWVPAKVVCGVLSIMSTCRDTARSRVLDQIKDVGLLDKLSSSPKVFSDSTF